MITYGTFCLLVSLLHGITVHKETDEPEKFPVSICSNSY